MDREKPIRLSPADFKYVGFVLKGLGFEVVKKDPTPLERLSSWRDHWRARLNARRAIVFR